MTPGEDQVIKCADCGEDFIFTAGEQAFYREHGLTHAPTRCKRCRDARKTSRPAGAESRPPRREASSSKEMYPAVCSECGAQTMVPFQPTSGRPIFCKNCFQSKRPPREGAPAARARSRARRRCGPW